MLNTIHYGVSSAHPASHYFDICLTIAEPDATGQVLWLPDWIPGSYMIRDFSRHLTPLKAFTRDGQSVSIAAIDKSSWRCAPVVGELLVRYRVYAWDMSVRTALLDQFGGFFNGTSLFLAVAGQEQRPVTITIEQPQGAEVSLGNTGEWRVATTLTRAGAEPLGFGDYCAANYDELIDHPVELGVFDYEAFDVDGVPHAIAITGAHRGNTPRLINDLKRICETQIRFFEEPAPFSEYLFLLRVVGSGYGGLEHRSSTSLICNRDDLPSANEPNAPSAGYTQLLGLCSHEYFHSWNVKRLKPDVMVAPNLRQPVHTELLWFFEGITSYYDDQFLLRSGVINVEAYAKLLSQNITRHLQTPGRVVQTLADSSFDAWTKYYQQNENTPNVVVSYYVKGAVMALCLDLMLRAQDHDLDNVMRDLWQRYGRELKGVSGDNIADVLISKLGSAAEQFLQQALHSTEELPWQNLLEDAGAKVTLSAANSVSLGVRTQAADDGGVQLRVVDPSGAAAAAGLSAGDVIIALDNLRVNAANWDKRIAQYAAGDSISVYAFRRDEWLSCRCVVAAAAHDTCSLVFTEDPSVWPASLASSN
ncbi:MAG: M61 family metallopeptidase [Paraperlucidibaca sp.]|nr:M61 family metallopeptidase [Paraperlucidibaca sp.]